jgi:hypothetical protein
MDIYWEGPEDEGAVLTYPKVSADSIEAGAAFAGHRFYVTMPGDKTKMGESVEIDSENAVYLFKLEGGTGVWEKSPKRIAVTSMPARFRNRRNDNLDQYWISGSTWVFQGKTSPKDESGQNVYTTHKFAFCKAGKHELENCKNGGHIAIFTIRAEKFIYTIDANEDDAEFVKYAEEEATFVAAYKKRTGRHWQAIYPRNKPLHPLWPAEFVGQKHTISTKFKKGLCDSSVGAKMIDDHVSGKHIEMRRRMAESYGGAYDVSYGAEVMSRGRRRLIAPSEDIPSSLRGAMGGETGQVRNSTRNTPCTIVEGRWAGRGSRRGSGG